MIFTSLHFYGLCALSSLNIVSDLTYLCSMRSVSSKYYAWYIFSMYSMFSIFSMCSACIFSPVSLFPTTKLGSNHSIHFCSFEIVLSSRGDVGLMIILKQGYILHISNTQRKYASSENSFSKTLHLRILFHKQFALHIWSTISAPLSRPSVQCNGRAPAHYSTESHIKDTGWIKNTQIGMENIFQ